MNNLYRFNLSDVLIQILCSIVNMYFLQSTGYIKAGWVRSTFMRGVKVSQQYEISNNVASMVKNSSGIYILILHPSEISDIFITKYIGRCGGEFGSGYVTLFMETDLSTEVMFKFNMRLLPCNPFYINKLTTIRFGIVRQMDLDEGVHDWMMNWCDINIERVDNKLIKIRFKCNVKEEDATFEYYVGWSEEPGFEYYKQWEDSSDCNEMYIGIRRLWIMLPAKSELQCLSVY